MADLIVCLEHEAPRRIEAATFFAENDFDAEQRWHIELALDQSGHYRGGGGAAPQFLVFNAPGSRRAGLA